MYHSRKIGVFISHLFGEYQHNLCQGILDTAKEYGYLVEIFASTDGETPNTLAGEEGILTIPSYQDFDGIIFANGTYPEYRLADAIYEQVTHCLLYTSSHQSEHICSQVNNCPAWCKETHKYIGAQIQNHTINTCLLYTSRCV